MGDRERRMRMSTKRGRAVIGALILVAGVVAFVVTWIAAPERADRDWVVAQGQVSLIVDAAKDQACRADSIKAPVFDYRTPQGVFSEVGSPWCNMGASIDTWKVGDTAKVAYNPDDPATAVIVGEGAPSFPYGFLFFSALLAAIGGWVLWSARRMPTDGVGEE